MQLLSMVELEWINIDGVFLSLSRSGNGGLQPAANQSTWHYKQLWVCREFGWKKGSEMAEKDVNIRP